MSRTAVTRRMPNPEFSSAVAITVGVREIVDIRIAQRETELNQAISQARQNLDTKTSEACAAEKTFHGSLRDATNTEFVPRMDAIAAAIHSIPGLQFTGKLSVTWNEQYCGRDTRDEYTVSIAITGNYTQNSQITKPLTETQKALRTAWEGKRTEMDVAAGHLNKCRQMLANLPSEERQIRAGLAKQQLAAAGAGGQGILDALDGIQLPALPALPVIPK